MADMSNRSLALLLVAAIVISLGGTMISLSRLSQIGITGMAQTGYGDVNLTVSTNASCTVDTNVNFGSGHPTATYTLSTDQNNNQYDFSCDGSNPGTGNCWGILVNNTGNVRLDVNFTSNKDGATFLGPGHTANDFNYWIDDSEIESNSCTTEGSPGQVSTNERVICQGLNFTDSSDVIVIDFNVTIDQNTVPGGKNATMTVTCQQE